ncbi:MAG TPA: hypothetical protein VHB46_02110 [Burkholderiales bacterium]|nr:hypothetical protein [Burkholderiales bacterium]
MITVKWIPGAIASAMLWAAMCAVAADDPTREELKRDAINRVIEAHDVSLPVYIGRVYVKQAALKEARDLLAARGKAAGLGVKSWNMDVPQWQAAERELMAGIDDLIRRKVASGYWVQEAWSQEVAGVLNGEEADEVAVHFRTEGGELQRRVIEWFVGELTLQTYTFTDRLKYGVPGSENEMRDLQIVTSEAKSHFAPIYDLTKYEGTMRFANSEAGIKYFRMMAMQGVGILHAHLESVATEARQMIRSHAALVDPYVENARPR